MILDVVIVFLLVLFCVRSFRAGVKGELFGAIGWLLAIVIAIASSTAVGKIFTEFVPQLDQLSPYFAFLVMVLFLRLITRAAIKAIPEQLTSPTSIIFNIIATGFGFFKGAFFISVVFLLLTKTGLQSSIDGYAVDSLIYPRLKNFSKSVVKVTADKVPNMETILERLG